MVKKAKPKDNHVDERRVPTCSCCGQPIRTSQDPLAVAVLATGEFMHGRCYGERYIRLAFTARRQAEEAQHAA